MKILNIKNKNYLFLVFVFFFIVFGIFSISKDASAAVCQLALGDFSLNEYFDQHFSIAPLSGPTGEKVTLTANFKWTDKATNDCKNSTVIYWFTSDQGLNETGEFIIPTGVKILSSQVFITGNPSQVNFKFTTQAKGLINLNLGSSEIAFQVKTDQYSCGFINPGDSKWQCIGNPDQNGLCPTACITEAKKYQTTCQSIRTPLCGTVSQTVFYGCLAPISETQSKYFCSTKNNDASCNDPSVATSCSGQMCVNMSAGGRTNLCGTTITTGGGDGNCGGTGQPACPPGQTTTYPFEVPNPLQGGANTVAELVGIIVKWIFSIAIPIAVAVIVYSGILFLTSKGDPGKVTKAREMLQYAIIGLAIILVGSGFISLIRSILELGAGPTP